MISSKSNTSRIAVTAAERSVMHASGFPKILGTATLNDKGQLVIPVEARNDLGLTPGSRVVIMSSTHNHALVLIKAEEVEAMLKDMSTALQTDTKND